LRLGPGAAGGAGRNAGSPEGKRGKFGFHAVSVIHLLVNKTIERVLQLRQDIFTRRAAALFPQCQHLFLPSGFGRCYSLFIS
jgi:hypothetical protein